MEQHATLGRRVSSSHLTPIKIGVKQGKRRRSTDAPTTKLKYGQFEPEGEETTEKGKKDRTLLLQKCLRAGYNRMEG